MATERGPQRPASHTRWPTGWDAVCMMGGVTARLLPQNLCPDNPPVARPITPCTSHTARRADL